MTKIIDIKKLRNNTYLVTFNVNSVTKTHVLTEDTIIKFNILKSKDIEDKEYKKIISINEDDVLYQKALHFINYQMRTISETKKHLHKNTKDETVINRIIKKLKDQQFLNDSNYVKEYVTQKIEFDLVGPKYIKDKLIQKGIHYDLITENLITFHDELQFGKIEEIIKKETKYPIKKPFKKAYISLKGKLVNKGFSLNIIESQLTSFRDIIKESCLEDELITKELDMLLKKFDKTDFKEKDKIIQKLLQKGFDYNTIKKYV